MSGTGVFVIIGFLAKMPQMKYYTEDGAHLHALLFQLCPMYPSGLPLSIRLLESLFCNSLNFPNAVLSTKTDYLEPYVDS